MAGMGRAERLDRIMISAIPIRKLNINHNVIGNRSGCLINYHGSRFILTAAHHIEPDQRWAAEIRANYHNHMTQVYLLGGLTFLFTGNLETGEVRQVDLAYQSVPGDLISYHQEFTVADGLTRESERPVFPLIEDVALNRRALYGFCGQANVDIAAQAGYLGLDHRFEPDLRYVRDEDDLHVFRLNHAHPGHEYYEGCSGAPILDSQGRLVALVVGGGEGDLIYAISPQVYANVFPL
jgi:hypothetical protein